MVMKYLIKDIFDFIGGNRGIYEEFIYQHLQVEGNRYKVLSSSLNEETEMGHITLTPAEELQYKTFCDKYGIHIARKGKAGSMRLLEPAKYITNEVAYIIYLKYEFKETLKINDIKEKEFLEWFILKFQNYVLSFASQTDNATWNKTNFFKDGVIEIDYKEIKKELIKLQDINIGMQIANKYISKINYIRTKQIYFNDSDLKPLSNYLSYVSRNDGLSEEGIYLMQAGFKENSKKITVISGNSNVEIYGYIPATEELHYINEKPCLACITRGNAGKLSFLPKGTYATNTNAMLLYIQNNKLQDLNIANIKEEENYLRFLKFYLEPRFINYASSSDLSVFPMSKAIKEIEIQFNKYDFNIEKIATIDFELEKIHNSLAKLKTNLAKGLN